MASFGATLVIGHHFYFVEFLHRTPRFPTQDRIHFLGKKKQKISCVGRTLPSSGRRLCITESPARSRAVVKIWTLAFRRTLPGRTPADTPQTP
ncbi:hypothetical protein CDAR_562861 [Caerostris darwini]|uniref:Uncharacterized protein n=1 Tax=Caerostris darwini TaxID=1538125 RepID=A0AAV4X7F6_9ARAC|nr:hypothetical protein CDAR_562861 [Caerostris darwini]